MRCMHALEARGGAPDHGGTAASSTLLRFYSEDEVARVAQSALLATAGKIRPAGELDMFRLDIPHDGTVATIRSAGSTDTYARLLTGTGAEVAVDDRDGNFRIEAKLDAGVYYVEVGAHEAGAYRLLAWGDPAQPCPCPAREIADHGEVAETATLMGIGPPLTGTIGSAADIDVFRLDLAGNATVEWSTSGASDTRGRLLDAGGKVLSADDDGGPGGHNFKIVETLEPGVYYVEVTGDAGSYALRARLGGATDHGDTPESSTVLTLYTSADLRRVSPSALLATSGRIEPARTDLDVFRVEVPVDGSRVTMRSSGSTDTYARLVDSSLHEVTSADGEGNFRIETELDAGIYYLEVGGHERGAYRVLAWSDVP